MPRWVAALETTWSLHRHGGSEAPRHSAKGLLKSLDGSPHGLGRAPNTPGAPNREQIMRQADQTPFATDVLQATQQEAAEPTRFFDLAKHGFHDDLASRVQCLPGGRPYFRRHALFCRGGWSARLSLRAMMPLAPRRHVRIEPYSPRQQRIE